MGNVEFMIGDAVDLIPRMLETGIRPDVIVVDPPRAGCERRVLETFDQKENLRKQLSNKQVQLGILMDKRKFRK